MPTFELRSLTSADVEAYRALRLAALADSPQSFSASVEDEMRLSDADMASRAVPEAPGMVIGAFAGGDLVGIASYVGSDRVKTRHKGMMVGVYIAPEWRGAGLGRQLVETIVAHARGLGVILHCTVTTNAKAARRLYAALGFQPYGIERDALLVDGVFLDEELLALDLRQRLRSEDPV